MKNISMEKVLTMRVPFPSISLQHSFAARVAEIRELETAQAASGQRLDDLFHSLLHRAFQGEL
jgi:type I restriction enzyme S subunit